MKYLLAFLLINTPIVLFAQNVSIEVYTFMKADDASAFAEYINRGNDVNACLVIEKSSYTILTLSIKVNSPQVFAKCIELNADLDLICSDKTALMYAIKYDRKDMLVALLEAGADIDQRSSRGKSAIEYTQKYNKPHLASLLE